MCSVHCALYAPRVECCSWCSCCPGVWLSGDRCHCRPTGCRFNSLFLFPRNHLCLHVHTTYLLRRFVYEKIECMVDIIIIMWRDFFWKFSCCSTEPGMAMLLVAQWIMKSTTRLKWTSLGHGFLPFAVWILYPLLIFHIMHCYLISSSMILKLYWWSCVLPILSIIIVLINFS